MNNKVIEKIKKLLATANDKGATENEAQVALLKAQELMAKYDVEVEYSDEETIEYSRETCVHRYNAGYRVPLCQVIAKNFRCQVMMVNNSVVFFGRANDAKVAKEVFEYAYEFAMKEGNRLENKAYKEKGTAKGVHSSYTFGFVAGLKEALDAQCTALMIVTPQDVKDKFAEITADSRAYRGGARATNNIDHDAYMSGKQDGRTVMNGRRISD